MKIDFRSDTVTKPTPEMLNAMFEAQVGDDVFGEDPSINALQEKAATLFGMESALFCPSGTMTNQIAVQALAWPGSEVICEHTCHIYRYEGGGIAYNALASVAPLIGDRGRLTAMQIEDRINPTADAHYPRTSLVCLENTCNKGGGSFYDFGEILRIRQVCDRHGLKLHLDGARLWNALVETPQVHSDYGKVFDSISVCLSKGLGAPSGSLLLGSRELISQAHRIRKRMGGGMRQAGSIAAAGIYALDHNQKRLKEDHDRARALSKTIQSLPYVDSILPVDTNILIFQLAGSVNPKAFLQFLSGKNLLAVHFGGQLIRFVTHLEINDEMIHRAEEILKDFR